MSNEHEQHHQHEHHHGEHRPHGDKTYTIIVNGRHREVKEHKLSYLQVVQLAYPGEKPSETVSFTVTYSNPRGKDGSLVEGEHVVLHDGMIFNVRKTDRS